MLAGSPLSAMVWVAIDQHLPELALVSHDETRQHWVEAGRQPQSLLRCLQAEQGNSVANQALFHCQPHGLRAVGRTEFAKEIGDMKTHGGLANAQSGSNIGVF
jgi:hypothetical protein